VAGGLPVVPSLLVVGYVVGDDGQAILLGTRKYLADFLDRLEDQILPRWLPAVGRV